MEKVTKVALVDDVGYKLNLIPDQVKTWNFLANHNFEVVECHGVSLDEWR